MKTYQALFPVVVVLPSILLFGPPVAAAESGESAPPSGDAPFLAAEIHGSLISDVVSWSILAGAFGYSVRGGYRWGGWGLFGEFEQDFWYASEHEGTIVTGAANLGVGVDYLYAGGFVHTSLVIGPSILAFDTILDEAGTVGLFLELRPVGLRWVVHENVALTLEPITFALVAPVLVRIPLIFPQYRTVFSVEAGW